MKKLLFIKISFISIMLCVCNTQQAQKYEINSFEKQNKEMLKQLKKQYGSSAEVKLTDDGFFYLVLSKKEYKKGPEKFFLLDEVGSPLYPDWIDNYNTIKGGYFYVGQNSGSKTKWGVINLKGKQVLPIQFDNIQQSEPLAAGNYTISSLNLWHPATNGFWLTTENSSSLHKFYSIDGSSIMHEYNGKIKSFLSYYWTIDGQGTNSFGLLRFDGEVIYPQEYSAFKIEPSGIIICKKKQDDGLMLCGGKLLDQTISTIEVPTIFNDLEYDTSTRTIRCKVHRDDEYEIYNPQITYEIKFKDKGERLYDMGKYQDVITYYEGEGYGTAWGDYYMGLSAEKIAKTEMDKMNNVINTLNSSKNYYLPIQNPEKYTFDAGTISSMYTSAGIYFEKYINNDKISPNDPTMVKARKKRGEVITARNNVTKKIEEYGTALQSATSI